MSDIGSALKALKIDFVSGQARHRRMYGGGKGQLIAKAVGLKKYQNPSVFDVTAGLGRDAFVLATLGCDVTMIERNSHIAKLLKDALQKLFVEPWAKELKLKLVEADAIDFLSKLSVDDFPDVIYIDPMFPPRTKSALVKKEMRLLKEVVGEDLDADELLNTALSKAKKRVVVKRPKLADCLAGREPDVVYAGKSGRFDVYVCC